MQRKGLDWTILRIIAYVIVSFAALVCFLPFLMLVSSSFTEEMEILKNGFSLFPSKFSLEAYKFHIRDQVFQVETCFPAGYLRCRIDPDAVSQAVLNLLDNARKYSAELAISKPENSVILSGAKSIIAPQTICIAP